MGEPSNEGQNTQEPGQGMGLAMTATGVTPEIVLEPLRMVGYIYRVMIY